MGRRLRKEASLRLRSGQAFVQGADAICEPLPAANLFFRTLLENDLRANRIQVITTTAQIVVGAVVLVGICFS